VVVIILYHAGISTQYFSRDSIILNGDIQYCTMWETLFSDDKVILVTRSAHEEMWGIDTDSLAMEWNHVWINGETHTGGYENFALSNNTFIRVLNVSDIAANVDGIKLINYDLDGNVLWESFSEFNNENYLNTYSYTVVAEGFYFSGEYAFLPFSPVYFFSNNGEILHHSVIHGGYSGGIPKILDDNDRRYALTYILDHFLPGPIDIYENHLWMQEIDTEDWVQVLDSLPPSPAYILNQSIILGDTLFYLGIVSTVSVTYKPIIGIDLNTFVADTFYNGNLSSKPITFMNELLYDSLSKCFIYIPLSAVDSATLTRNLLVFDLIEKEFLWNTEISYPREVEQYYFPGINFFFHLSGGDIFLYLDKLYNIDFQTGEIQWSYDLKAKCGFDGFSCNGIYLRNNNIFISGTAHYNSVMSEEYRKSILYRLRETDTGIQVEEFSPPPSITLSPIPASDQLSLSSMANMTHVDVYDIHGSRIQSMDIPEVSEWQISVADMPPGIYVLQVRDRAGVIFSQRWVKV